MILHVVNIILNNKGDYMKPTKRIALVAHDKRKEDLLEWALHNKFTLMNHSLYATGTTGKFISESCNIPVTCLKSGPLGGDQQLGAKIANGELDIMIFFWDPMTSQPHDVDVKALLRMTVVYNIPVACNRATADFMISSHLFDEEYKPQIKDYNDYIKREM
jgi:methylglyoxal synthase